MKSCCHKMPFSVSLTPWREVEVLLLKIKKGFFVHHLARMEGKHEQTVFLFAAVENRISCTTVYFWIIKSLFVPRGHSRSLLEFCSNCAGFKKTIWITQVSLYPPVSNVVFSRNLAQFKANPTTLTSHLPNKDNCIFFKITDNSKSHVCFKGNDQQNIFESCGQHCIGPVWASQAGCCVAC